MIIHTIENTEYGVVRKPDKKITADDLISIVTEIFNPPNNYILPKYSIWVVIYVEEEVAGLVAITFLSPYSIWISELGVIEKYRRQGVGTSLIKYVKLIAMNNNFRILLDSDNTEEVKKFYLSIGGKILESDDNSINWSIIVNK